VNKSKTEEDIHITFYLCRNHCRTYSKQKKHDILNPRRLKYGNPKQIVQTRGGGRRSLIWKHGASELQRQGQTLDQAALVGTLDPEHLNSQGPSTLRRMKLEDRSYFHPRKRSLLRTLVRKTIKALLEIGRCKW
jgi:hypothetical protein